MKALVLVISVCCSLLAACNQVDKTPKAIQFAVAQAPINLDPRYATDAASERVNRLIYQRLVEFNAASKVMPGMANWQKRSDKEYQFTLRASLPLFHHQKSISANDVKATYDSFAQLKNSPHSAEFGNIQSIQVLSERDIQFTLKQADAHFPEKLIIGILPADLIANGHDFSHAPVGNGPLNFVSWQNALVLKRISDGQVIEINEVKDPTVRVLKLQRGEADILQGDLPPELVKHLQAKPEIVVQTSVGANYSYLGLNMQDPLLKQLKVRQAIAYAIDRQAIVNKVMVENTRLAGAILPPEHYAGNAHLTPYTYNPTLSKQLLNQAGIHLPLKLVYKTSTDAQRVRIATILQAQMVPAGIDLEIRSLDWGTFFEDVKKGKFQLFGLTWVGINTPEIYSKAFGSAYFPPNGFNRGKYQDATLDAMMQNENWPAATQRTHEQLPYIPLWYEGQFAAFNKNIKGYSPQANGNWDGLEKIDRASN